LTGIICSGVRFLKLLSQILPRFFGKLTILYLQQSASLCSMFEKVRKERLTVLLHFQIRCQTRSDGHTSQLQSRLDLVLQKHSEKNKSGVKLDRKSTRLHSSHVSISYAVLCLK